jgi:hypothetical protein
LLASLVSSVISISLAFLLLASYRQDDTLRNSLESLFRLEGVSGTEVLVLALAFVLGQFIQLIALMVFSIRTFNVNYRPLLRLLAEAFLAALAGGFSAYAALIFIVNGINQDTFIGISLQGLVAGVIGMTAVILVYRVLKAPEIFEIYRSFHSKIFKTDVIAPQPDTI